MKEFVKGAIIGSAITAIIAFSTITHFKKDSSSLEEQLARYSVEIHSKDSDYKHVLPIVSAIGLLACVRGYLRYKKGKDNNSDNPLGYGSSKETVYSDGSRTFEGDDDPLHLQRK